MTVKLHLTLFHGSKGRRRMDAIGPAISAASAAQAFANFELVPGPVLPKTPSFPSRRPGG